MVFHVEALFKLKKISLLKTKTLQSKIADEKVRALALKAELKNIEKIDIPLSFSRLKVEILCLQHSFSEIFKAW